MWDVKTGSYGNNLKEQFTNDEDVINSMCTCVALQDGMLVAGFKNGE